MIKNFVRELISLRSSKVVATIVGLVGPKPFRTCVVKPWTLIEYTVLGLRLLKKKHMDWISLGDERRGKARRQEGMKGKETRGDDDGITICLLINNLLAY